MNFSKSLLGVDSYCHIEYTSLYVFILNKAKKFIDFFLVFDREICVSSLNSFVNQHQVSFCYIQVQLFDRIVVR